jgi:hypothetical protein
MVVTTKLSSITPNVTLLKATNVMPLGIQPPIAKGYNNVGIAEIQNTKEQLAQKKH